MFPLTRRNLILSSAAMPLAFNTVVRATSASPKICLQNLFLQQGCIFLRRENRQTQVKCVLSPGQMLSPGVSFRGCEIFTPLTHLNSPGFHYFLLVSLEKQIVVTRLCQLDSSNFENAGVTVLADISQLSVDSQGDPLLGDFDAFYFVTKIHEKFYCLFLNQNSRKISQYVLENQGEFVRCDLNSVTLFSKSSLHNVPADLFCGMENVYLVINSELKTYEFYQWNVDNNAIWNWDLLLVLDHRRALDSQWDFQFSSFNIFDEDNGDECFSALECEEGKGRAFIFHRTNQTLCALKVEKKGDVFQPHVLAITEKPYEKSKIYFYNHFFIDGQQVLLAQDMEKRQPFLLSLEKKNEGYEFVEQSVRFSEGSFTFQEALKSFFSWNVTSESRVILSPLPSGQAADGHARLRIQKAGADTEVIYDLCFVNGEQGLVMTPLASSSVLKVVSKTQPGHAPLKTFESTELSYYDLGHLVLSGIFGTLVSGGVLSYALFRRPSERTEFVRSPQFSHDFLCLVNRNDVTGSGTPLSAPIPNTLSQEEQLQRAVQGLCDNLSALNAPTELKGFLKDCLHSDLATATLHLVFGGEQKDHCLLPNFLTELEAFILSARGRCLNLSFMDQTTEQSMKPVVAMGKFLAAHEGKMLFAEMFPDIFDKTRQCPSLIFQTLMHYKQGKYQLDPGLSAQHVFMTVLWEGFVSNAFEAAVFSLKSISDLKNSSRGTKQRVYQDVLKRLNGALKRQFHSETLRPYFQDFMKPTLWNATTQLIDTYFHALFPVE